MQEPKTLLLVAGTRTSGSPVFEEVPVLTTDRGDRFQVLSSPGLVLGLAAGDVIELVPRAEGEFRVVARGGNVCVQVFRQQAIDQLVAASLGRLEALGGILDGKAATEAVFTIPVSVGFPAIEAFLAELQSQFPDGGYPS